MASLFPENITIRGSALCLVALLAAAHFSVNAQTSTDAVSEDRQGRPSERQTDMPIMIDADSSEFDYEGGHLVFRGLRLDQGDLGIRADTAETDKLDFNEGEWNFSGNVLVEARNTRLECDSATLRFKDNELVGATLHGTPARFEQPDSETAKINSGEAEEIVFDVQDGTLNLMGEAKFSDGTNEISGELITYDLTRGKLTAGAGDSGPVKILIEPPSRSEGAPQSP